MLTQLLSNQTRGEFRLSRSYRAHMVRHLSSMLISSVAKTLLSEGIKRAVMQRLRETSGQASCRSFKDDRLESDVVGFRWSKSVAPVCKRQRGRHTVDDHVGARCT